MKSTEFVWAYLLIMSVCMVSCNPGIYVPAFQNVPLLQKKGEVNLLVSGTNVQGAVAVGKKIGIALNVQTIGRNSGRSGLLASDRSNQLRGEGAVGYFTHQKSPKSGLLAVYTGGGYGKVDYTRNEYHAAPTFDSRNWNVFIQPAIGFTGKKTSVVFSTKINYVGYTNSVISLNSSGLPPPYDPLQVEYNKSIQVEYNQLSCLSNANYLFVEPALTVTIGGKYVRMILQQFYSIPIINQSQYKVIDHRLLYAQFGLWLSLNRRAKRQKPT